MKIRHLLYLGLIVSLFSSCAASKQHGQKKADQVISYAYKYQGTPYRSGGNTPKGFDCSGYVQYVFKEFNYELPRTTTDQSKTGKKLKKKDIQPGDLVFFKGRNKRKKTVGHVGIVVDVGRRGEFRFIHASTSRGIVVTHSSETYYKERYLTARRII